MTCPVDSPAIRCYAVISLSSTAAVLMLKSGLVKPQRLTTVAAEPILPTEHGDNPLFVNVPATLILQVADLSAIGKHLYWRSRGNTLTLAYLGN